ncbi:MAG: hypothetical protein ACFCBW_22180 [Candidatus Competibacterales bacterium]
MRVGEGGLNADLVNDARTALRDDRTISQEELLRLKNTALEGDNRITDNEQAFLANLDREPLITQLSREGFNAAHADLNVDGGDTLFMAGQEVHDPGHGAAVFVDGQVNPDSLAEFSQTNNSSGANAACSCNSSVAALAMEGPDAMGEALQQVTMQISPPTEDQVQDFATLTRISANLEAGTLTTADLNDFSSTLHNLYDSNKDDNIMTYPDVIQMRRDLGLAGADAEKQDEVGANVGQVTFSTVPPNRGQVVGATVDVTSEAFQDAQRETANEVTEGIGNGQSALVGVFNGTGTDRPNHFVEVGRNEAGELYLYDPLGEPRNFLTGQAAEDHLARHIGVSFGNPQLAGGQETYDVRTAAPVIPRD